MERGGSSNVPHKCSTRAPESGSPRGIVIREGAVAPSDANPSIPATGASAPPPQVRESFKRNADHYVPVANVTRIMRRILPPHAKIADDAKETVQECVTAFIALITAEANRRCHSEYRKTISPEDLLSAMATLRFGNYVETLTVFLNRYRAQDPEGSSSQFRLPVVRRGAGQPPASQVPRLSPPVVQPVSIQPVNVGGYVPAPPAMMMTPPDNAADGGDEYVDLPQLMNEYLMGNQGGSSGEVIGVRPI